MQDYLASRPQLERGALGSAVIAGGVEMFRAAVQLCGVGVTTSMCCRYSTVWCGRLHASFE